MRSAKRRPTITVARNNALNSSAWGGNEFGQGDVSAALGQATKLAAGQWQNIIIPMVCDGVAPSDPTICACGFMQVDSNSDGTVDCLQYAYGDLDLSGVVSAADLSLLLAHWGMPDPTIGDLDDNNAIDAADLSLLLAHWGNGV